MIRRAAGFIQSLAARLFLTDNTMVHHVNHAVANKVPAASPCQTLTRHYVTPLRSVMQVRAKLMAKGIESDFQEADGKIKITVRHLAKVPGVPPGATDCWSVRSTATTTVVV